MKTYETQIEDNRGRNCKIIIWKPHGETRAVIQISHGMAEHIERYEDFARYMCANGIAVAAGDHPGHGITCPDSELGYFGDGGYEGIIDRMYSVTQYIKGVYCDTPLILLGHSMGSLLVRAYITRYGNETDAAIIMGTSGPNPSAGLGLFLVNLLAVFKGERGKSKLINAMMFGSYTKRFSEASSFCWLSRDTAVVKKYDTDKYCGYPFTLNGYRGLLKVLIEISRKDWAYNVPKTLPILLISGSEDPVGNYGRGVTVVSDRLKAAGAKCRTVIREGNRHEVLNETDKEKTYAILLDFICSVIKSEAILA